MTIMYKKVPSKKKIMCKKVLGWRV